MNGVPGSGTTESVASAIRTPICPAMPTNLRSRPPAISRTRHGDFAESVPVRRLGALSHAAETVGQANGAIAQPDIALQAQNLVREEALALPDREPLPLADERLDSGFLDRRASS